jgi:hypothetical protein
VLGYRRFAAEDVLATKLAEQPAVGCAELAWALGRVGSTSSLSVLWPLLAHDDEDVREAAAVALMRLGDGRPIDQALQQAHQSPWVSAVLAVGGTRDAVTVLLNGLKAGTADEHAVVAVGMLGDLSAVMPLLELLDDERLAGAASTALNTITGAQLHAPIFVPDALDRDEHSDDEREALDRDGTVPAREGRPYGTFERRALRDKAAWHSWLSENRHRFDRQLRWRMGKPHGPEALLDTLASEYSPTAIRSATYDELTIRFGLNVPFEVDLPVLQQERFLRQIADWVSAKSGEFDLGSW